MLRWHPLIMLCLVQKCAWSAKSPVPQMCLLRQRFQPGVTISLLSLQSRGTWSVCVCVCTSVHACTRKYMRVCVCVWDSEEEVPLGIGCSTGEDKVGWCLLTWPMIHNWGRTAVAGCTDRSRGWWQMIGPCGAKLSLTLGELFQMFSVRYLLTCPSWACLVYVNQAVTDPQSVWPHWMSQCKWTQYYEHLHNWLFTNAQQNTTFM